jgi:hypothetical protein
MPETGPTPPAPLVAVRTLLCHRDVPLMLDCWRTLVACSAEPFATVVHDDGSLTEADEAAIVAAIPRARVLRRAVADALMAERLARHEQARAFRAQSVWGLKLLDVVLAEPGDCYYVDGDVRFFRRFRGLFDRAALAGRCVFLRDTVWIAYSIRPWHLLDRRRLRVAAGLNSGLALVDRAVFDLDFVDWFLGQPDWRVIPAWTEPTCWAALAARHDGHAIDPKQVTNLYPGAGLTPETIGAHFLSAYRDRFRAALTAAPRLAEPVADLRFIRLGRAGPFALGCNQLKRKLTNTWTRRRDH